VGSAVLPVLNGHHCRSLRRLLLSYCAFQGIGTVSRGCGWIARRERSRLLRHPAGILRARPFCPACLLLFQFAEKDNAYQTEECARHYEPGLGFTCHLFLSSLRETRRPVDKENTSLLIIVRPLFLISLSPYLIEANGLLAAWRCAPAD
jgi:hypothetical protein